MKEKHQGDKEEGLFEERRERERCLTQKRKAERKLESIESKKGNSEL